MHCSVRFQKWTSLKSSDLIIFSIFLFRRFTNNEETIPYNNKLLWLLEYSKWMCYVIVLLCENVSRPFCLFVSTNQNGTLGKLLELIEPTQNKCIFVQNSSFFSVCVMFWVIHIVSIFSTIRSIRKYSSQLKWYWGKNYLHFIFYLDQKICWLRYSSEYESGFRVLIFPEKNQVDTWFSYSMEYFKIIFFERRYKYSSTFIMTLILFSNF